MKSQPQKMAMSVVHKAREGARLAEDSHLTCHIHVGLGRPKKRFKKSWDGRKIWKVRQYKSPKRRLLNYISFQVEYIFQIWLILNLQCSTCEICKTRVAVNIWHICLKYSCLKPFQPTGFFCLPCLFLRLTSPLLSLFFCLHSLTTKLMFQG